MLTRIEIRNFAIIDQLAIDWQSGLSVITGETGAGKSIAIDALNLALGGRADTAMIANQADKAEVVALFEPMPNSAADNWLQTQELADGGECILRRVVASNGRSKCFINGRSVTRSSLNELGQLLVDIHGQHSQQSLLRKRDQLNLLDRFGQHQKLLNAVSAAAESYQQLQTKRDLLQQAEADRLARLELLTYQVDELEQASPSEQLLTNLETRHREAATVGERIQLSQQLSQLLDSDDENALMSQVAHLMSVSESLTGLDPKATALADTLTQAQDILQEFQTELRHYEDCMEHDPAALAELDEQLALFHELARKHQVQLEQLPDKLQSLSEELTELNQAQNELGVIDQQCQAARSDYLAVAEKLSTQRHKTANKLNQSISQLIQQLSMEGGRFEVAIESTDRTSSLGIDDVEFLVSANPGQPLQPLAKVASGGELSRISLAIAVVTAKQQLVPSLIFDEVDVGIGGATAEVVGRLLRQLGSDCQVVCVTHQPQVAACGHHHLRAEKTKTKQSTATSTQKLTAVERIEEIARMLGGIEISETTRKNASEMLAACVE